MFITDPSRGQLPNQAVVKLEVKLSRQGIWRPFQRLDSALHPSWVQVLVEASFFPLVFGPS